MPESTEEREQISKKAEGFKSVYANNIRMDVNFWDFRFHFSEIEEANAERLVLSESVRVVMSPQHTKAFLGVLAENMEKWEQKFGEIRVPKAEAQEDENEEEE